MISPAVVIVGGGVSGLAAAFELRQRGVPFVLVEAAARCGGVVVTERIGGYLIDAGPDALLTQKPAALQLCGELGLAGRLSPQRSRTVFVARHGSLRALPEGAAFGIPTDWMAFVTTRAFSWAARLRMATECLRPPRPSRDDESIASFIGRRLGRGAVEYLAEPLLAGIHGGDARTLSMRALFPRLLAMEERDGGLIRGFRRMRQDGPGQPPFASFPDGVCELTDALVESLPAESIRTGAAVRSIEHRGVWSIELDGGRRLDAPAVLLATPPHVTAALTRALDPSLAAACSGIRAASVATVALGYPRRAVGHPLDGGGFVVPRREHAQVSAVSWVSSKWEGRAPSDHVLMRVYLGGARDPGAVDLADHQMTSRAHAYLERVLRIDGDPVLSRVYRWPNGSPLLEVGHHHVIERIEHQLQRWPGLFVSAAGFRGVGIADCIADARSQAAWAACSAGVMAKEGSVAAIPRTVR